jgi:hypothetical protein
MRFGSDLTCGTKSDPIAALITFGQRPHRQTKFRRAKGGPRVL